MPDDELEQLELGISSHSHGNVIFKINEESNSVPYLIQGKCQEEVSNGSGYPLNAKTFKSLYPLTNSRQFQCTVIAKSDVNILYFPANVLHLSR